MDEIEICMGSSCYSRKNGEILKQLERWIEEENLGNRISVKGSLCMNNCSKGPHIKINEIEQSDIDFVSIKKILNENLLNRKNQSD